MNQTVLAKKTPLVLANKKKKIKENLVGYLFITPWLLVFSVFVAFPFIYGFVISFFDFDLVNYTFTGFENYIKLFSDEMFINSILATLKMCAIIIPGTVLFSLWVANTIHNRKKSMQSFTKVVFYLSAIVSEVALVIVWQWIFNPGYGISATITEALQMPRIDWLGDVNFALPLVSYLVLAFTVAQPIVLYSAAFNNIPDTYYEAARIDGASAWKQFTKITLPLIRPTTTFVLITTTIGSLQVFMVPYLLTAGGPANGTTSMLLMIFHNAFEYGKYGYAAAMGVVLFIIIAIFAVFQFKATKSDVQY